MGYFNNQRGEFWASMITLAQQIIMFAKQKNNISHGSIAKR